MVGTAAAGAVVGVAVVAAQALRTAVIRARASIFLYMLSSFAENIYHSS
jgi:hypothetical protein